MVCGSVPAGLVVGEAVGGADMTPSYADAKNRRPVRLPDGRTARLIYLPGGASARVSVGARARVLLPSGAVLSVDPLTLVVTE